jgi:hypothetical protein
MISAAHRPEALSLLTAPTTKPATISSSTSSFARELEITVEGHQDPLKSGSQNETRAREAEGQNSGDSQFLATPKINTPTAVAPISSGPSAGTPSSSTLPVVTSPSNIPTMLGMGPVAGTAPVQQVTTAQTPALNAPVTEGDAYWDAQPAAVQALRNMPDGAAKNALALNLANQGYSIDTQIMVWGWDPQMTMTVRQNQGYSWVPSYGQANIAVGPGLSMPDNPNSYNPGNPPAGAIQVSTAFANGTIQNPLVQRNT